jgi:nitrogen fixation NifU-like protein
VKDASEWLNRGRERGSRWGTTFLTDGCGASTVCSSFAVELALVKDPEGLLEITGENFLELLGVLPPGEHHCAFLAADTLHDAMNDYMMKQARKQPKERLPWTGP